MFDVTSDEIAALTDTDLRNLVGRLCEEEVKKRGESSSAVTWGGRQDAPDGGLDVRVALPKNSVVQGFIPRPTTGFQVKKSAMPRTSILAEMAPGGEVRRALYDLANEGGAYIIVSSGESNSDSALQRRRQAMNEAVSTLAVASGLSLDFYDRNRLATWVRQHQSIVLWVRRQLGIETHGWRSYGDWTTTGSGAYLLDTKLSIIVPVDGQSMTATDGLQKLRGVLQILGSVVRLVGLSGVGKTRFAQALFDGQIGEGPLDPSSAFYVNIGDHPDPGPQPVVSNLIGTSTRAVVVVDNCSQELHRTLADICRAVGSTVSLLTIEYDIQEDLPEGTEVYKMDAPSVDLTEQILQERFPAISQIDAHTASTFADGNARVAITLAETIERSGSIAGLRDNVLFERLFHQKQPHDRSLLRAAQACALVYSFQVEDVTDDGELGKLGHLVGMTATELYEHVAALKRRDLVQARGPWRAILPQAIAHRLAATALQNIPSARIEHYLTEIPRLLKSFTRQLGYLHKSPEAQAIATQWLAPEGRLGNLGGLSDLSRVMFRNIAPARPEATLGAIERAVHESLTPSSQYIGVLRSLAYDPKLFDRCVMLLVCLADKTPDPLNQIGETWNEAGQTLSSLYFVALSGTQAPLRQRLLWVRNLLTSNDRKLQTLGVAALRNAMESWHFTSHGDFEFGAWPRAFDQPRTRQDWNQWFREVLTFIEEIIRTGGPAREGVPATIAKTFRGMWIHTGVQNKLEHICQEVADEGFWREGWLAIKETLHLHAPAMPTEHLHRLQALEARLRPSTLMDEVRSVVLSNSAGIDLADLQDEEMADADTWSRLERKAQELGRSVATDTAAYRALVDELLSGSSSRLFSFGRGLAEGADYSHAFWQQLTNSLERTTAITANVMILRGFMHELDISRPMLARARLDDAVTHDTLGRWFPELQIAAAIDTAAKDRLLRALLVGKAPIEQYGYLVNGGATAALAPDELGEILTALSATPEGVDTAIRILESRLRIDSRANQHPAPVLLKIGRMLLRQLPFPPRLREGYGLQAVAQKCLVGEDGLLVAREVASKLLGAINEGHTFSRDHEHLLIGLFGAQPTAMLDLFFAETLRHQESAVRSFDGLFHFRANPIHAIPEETLFAWCDQEAQRRYPIVARFIQMFELTDNQFTKRWSSLALHLLERAPERAVILQCFIKRFVPRSWSGSLAAALEANARMLDLLTPPDDHVLIAFIATEKALFLQRIDKERRSEQERSHRDYERFE